jgi:peptidoglycan hydrolase-like protein with peptidoglycan-binding domain
VALAVIVGAVALVGISVRWRDNTSPDKLGPSEAQQNRAQEQVVKKSAPPQQLSEVQIRRFQEQLDAAGFPTGSEKGTITPETENALRAYQQKNGLAVTGMLDEETQSSLSAGRTPAPGTPTRGESVPGGMAPSGSPR